MIQGVGSSKIGQREADVEVFTGLRVLFWAVVLLVSCMYLLGVVARTLFGGAVELDGETPVFPEPPGRCISRKGDEIYTRLI